MLGNLDVQTIGVSRQLCGCTVARWPDYVSIGTHLALRGVRRNDEAGEKSVPVSVMANAIYGYNGVVRKKS